MTSTLLVLLGLVLLVGGGELLVRGAASLATRLGLPSLVVGLTVVAFGTSAPELVVSLAAALDGSPDVAFGNVFGSNVANLGLILGVGALIRPLAVKVALVRREIPLLALASVVAAGIAAGGSFGRLAGMGLLVGFVGVFALTLYGEFTGRERIEVPEAQGARRPVGWLLLEIVLGLAGLLGGADLLVRGAVDLARGAGVPEAVIGATLVALATSLPELVTTVVAARRGQTDLAVGNVVGSNLFNLLLILGTTACVVPIPVPAAGRFDPWWAAGFAALLLPLAVTHGFRLVRWEAVLLLVLYAAFVAQAVA